MHRDRESSMKNRLAIAFYWVCMILAPAVAIALYRRIPTVLAYGAGFVVMSLGVATVLRAKRSQLRTDQEK